MSAALIIIWAVLGGLWRRAMGGWLAISRSTIVWAGLLTLSTPVGFVVGSATWWPYGLVAYVLTVGVSFLFFVCGLHAVDWLDDLIARYDIHGDGDFVDGHRAVTELVSGAVWWGAVCAICVVAL